MARFSGRKFKYTGELGLADLDRLAAQITAIELQEVERDQVRVMLHTAAAAHQFEHCKTLLVAHHRLAIDYTRSDLEQIDRFHNSRQTFTPVVAVAGQQSDALALA